MPHSRLSGPLLLLAACALAACTAESAEPSPEPEEATVVTRETPWLGPHGGAVFPLGDGWEARVALHQLAPLAVHAIKFGGGYVAATRRALATVR